MIACNWYHWTLLITTLIVKIIACENCWQNVRSALYKVKQLKAFLLIMGSESGHSII